MARSTSSQASAPAVPQMSARDYGLISLQSMLWGSSFFFIAVAAGALPPLTMSALRLVPACLVLLIVIAALGLRLPATRDVWARMLVMSAFNNVIPFVLIIIAQREVTGGVAAIFNATAPLFATLLAPLFVLEERLLPRRIIGCLFGVAGVAILVGGATATVSPTSASLLLAAAASYATANIMTRRFFAGMDPFVIACAQMIASLLIASAAAVIIDQPWTLPLPSGASVLAVMAMGTFGSALASLCHFTVLRRAGAMNSLLVTIILPLTPIILGAIWLGDIIHPRHCLGGLVIAFALVIIDGRAWQRCVAALKGATRERGRAP